MKKPLRLLAASALLIAMGGCATPRFNRQWEAETSGKAAREARDRYGIAGPWVGTWVSYKNDHTGDLRCLVEPLGGGRYLFRYWAEWGPNFKGAFKIACEVKPSGRGYSVEGSKTLIPFGTYHHEGRITSLSFTADFRSNRKNLGEFRLSRPEDWKK